MYNLIKKIKNGDNQEIKEDKEKNKNDQNVKDNRLNINEKENIPIIQNGPLQTICSEIENDNKRQKDIIIDTNQNMKK